MRLLVSLIVYSVFYDRESQQVKFDSIHLIMSHKTEDLMFSRIEIEPRQVRHLEVT